MNSAKVNESYFRSYFQFGRFRNLPFPAGLDLQGILTYSIPKNGTGSEKTAEVLYVQIPVRSEGGIEMNIFMTGAAILPSLTAYFFTVELRVGEGPSCDSQPCFCLSPR